MSEIEKIAELLKDAKRIVIVQADNPDADSLGSALALENIFGDMGKEPFLYCALDMPEYLKYMSGWDRVEKELPAQFDVSVIVDTSSVTLLEKLEKSAQKFLIIKRPCVVLDHHAGVICDIPYASVVLNDPAKVSTGELIYSLAKEVSWPLSTTAQEYIMSSILADSQGLSNENTTSQTYRVMAELVENGVNRPKLEEQRRLLTRMPKKIFTYKALLIERTEFSLDDKLAVITIPQEEITEFSPLYNPNPLIQNEHLQTVGVIISVSFKVYNNQRITASIRCNNEAPIADKVASRFGGDGHSYAAGFKTEGRNIVDVKSECINAVSELLNSLAKP